MCYKCEVCANVVREGKPLLKHTVYRDVVSHRLDDTGKLREVVFQQIASEIKVCGTCYTELQYLPLPVLRKRHEKPKEVSIEELESSRPYQPKPVQMPSPVIHGAVAAGLKAKNQRAPAAR